MGFLDKILPQKNKVVEVLNEVKGFDLKSWIIKGGSRALKDSPFAEVIFYDLYQMLADLTSDTKFEYKGANKKGFELFQKWYNKEFTIFLYELIYTGFAVFSKYKELKVYKPEEYKILDGKIVIDGIADNQIIVIKSDIYKNKTLSDYQFLASWRGLIDKYMNNSQRATEQEGKILFASHKLGNANMGITKLTEADAKVWEEDVKKNKGNFSDSAINVVLSTIPMELFEVDLTNFDKSNFEKMISCILIIAGHFGLPANQLPIIEKTAGRSLTNGGEMAVGDTLKDKAFLRYLSYLDDIFDFLNLDVNYNLDRNLQLTETFNTEKNENN